jgi:hypothetical protein
MPTIETIAKKPKWWGQALKVLISLLWLVICMEVAARLLFSINPPPRWLASSANSSTSWRLIWTRQHPVHQGELYGWGSGKFAVYDQTRGWALKPNIKDMTVFNGKILNSNSKGLRGSAEHDYQRNPSKRRILILGDSFTFGDEVSDDETYPHYLATALANTEILNLGVPGYGHDQMLLYLKEEGVKYHPDVVILGFVFPDTYRNLLTFFSYAKPEYKFVRGGVEVTNIPVPTPAQFLAAEPYRLKSLDVLEVARDRLWQRLGLSETRARDLTRLLLGKIVATTRGIGAVPVFVYLPVAEEILDSRDEMTGGERYLYDYCQDQSVPCLFLRQRFREEIKRGAKFNSYGHWNRAEHAAAAEGIKDFLLRDNLVKN